MMGREIPLQGLLELGAFRAQPPTRQVGESCDIPVARDERLQHRPRRDAADICDDGGQFDVRILQHRLHTVNDPGPVLHQGRAVPGELPQLSLRLGGDAAAPQKTVTQPLGNPLGILHVRVAPRAALMC